MADLEQVLGALLTGLAQARRMADEQTSAIAQYYQSSPLLAGMTVPRIRVPEMTVELPVLIDSLTQTSPAQLAQPAVIAAAANEALARTATDLAMRLPVPLSESLSRKLGTSLPAVLREAREKSLGDAVARESVAALAERAALESLDELPPEIKASLDPTRRARLVAGVKARVREAAVQSTGSPMSLKASVVTSEIKDRATPSSVARIRIVLREEGLEWQEVRRADGTSTPSLSPE